MGAAVVTVTWAPPPSLSGAPPDQENSSGPWILIPRLIMEEKEQVFINNHQRLEEEGEAGLPAEVFNGNFPEREPWDAWGVMDKRCIVVASG
ncbi:unnamed protein product [Arctogadus glacialis]